MTKKCIVMTSGGLDSTTILALAKEQNYEIYSLTFNYQQRHSEELKRARKIAKIYAKEHKIFDLDLRIFGGSSLTDDNIEVKTYSKDLPTNITSSYVPARNTIFLSIALAYAETINAKAIFCGANKSDYNNYPDCRPEFFEAYRQMANLGTKMGIDGNHIKILTPLIDMEKDAIIQLGMKLGVDYSNTISCYSPSEEGYSCGQCLSCRVRLQNFSKLGLKDETKYIR